MTAMLLRKELRALLPWGMLSLAFGLIEVFGMLLRAVDMRPLSRTFDPGSFGTLLWLVSFAIGTSLGIRERDDGTLAFLDGLPVSRTRVYLIKCGTMLALVALGPIAQLLGNVACHLLSRGSLDRALHAGLLLEVLSLEILLLANGLMLGAVFGLLRSLTWLAAGLVVVGFGVLSEQLPGVALLSPLSLLDLSVTGRGLEIDARTVATQAGLTLAAGLVSARRFATVGHTPPLPVVWGPVRTALLTASTAAALAAAVVVGRGIREDPEPSGSDASGEASPTEPYFQPSAPAQTFTRHFRISYPANRAGAALRLAEDADRIFEEIHALLGVEPEGPIELDASGSIRNTLGIATHGRIRLDLDGDTGEILAHETAHEIARRLVGGDQKGLFSHTPLLNEGLASWLDRRFQSDPDADDPQLALAALHARRELRVEELADPDRFATQWGPDLAYPIGEAVIGAVVERYGQRSLAPMLRAFGDPRLPSDLRGLELWQSVFQLAEMDLGSVLDAMFRRIDDAATQSQDAIASLPRPRLRLVEVGGWLGVQVLSDPDPTWPDLRLSFRPEPDSPLELIETREAQAGGIVFRGPEEIASGRVCVQVAVVLPGVLLPERWTCLSTADAISLDDDEEPGD